MIYLHSLFLHLNELIDEQRKEVQRAIIGRGKYKFRDDYNHLVIDEVAWFKMTQRQKERNTCTK